MREKGENERGKERAVDGGREGGRNGKVEVEGGRER